MTRAERRAARKGIHGAADDRENIHEEIREIKGAPLAQSFDDEIPFEGTANG
jgi:hypothetical protein